VDLFGEDSPAVHEAAGRLTRVLMAVFNKFHGLTLTGIKKLGKRPAKQLIEAWMGEPLCGRVLRADLASGPRHSIEWPDHRVSQGRGSDPSDSQPEEIEGFLTKLIPAKEGYEFYTLLRAQSESWHPSEKKAGPGPPPRRRQKGQKKK